jgi:hypothetical protein
MGPHAHAILFAGSELTHSRHVCAFFNSEDEAYKVLAPFIVDGFECGHKAVHLVNPGQRARHLDRLRCEGIEPETAEAAGQLDVRTNTDVYLSDGRFDPERMLATFETLASGNSKDSFPLSRIVCHMDWAGDGRSEVADLISFEARVNDLWRKHDDVVICVYDLARFGGEAVVDVLRTHPMVVVGGVLQENPFYVAPAQFLEELRERRSKRSVDRDDGPSHD